MTDIGLKDPVSLDPGARAAIAMQDTVAFEPPDAIETHEEFEPRFGMVWRGYDRDAVEEYLAQLEGELETVRAERRPDAGVREEIDRIGEETAAILRVAHERAEAIVSRAQARADLLVADADAQARAITTAAEQRLVAIDADTDAVWRDRARLVEDTRKLADALLGVADDAAERFPPEVEETRRPSAGTAAGAAAEDEF